LRRVLEPVQRGFILQKAMLHVHAAKNGSAARKLAGIFKNLALKCHPPRTTKLAPA
jgi:hypothetical protein